MLLVRSTPLETKEEVQQALQLAIQLEHATIPPYLTAQFSLMPGVNDTIKELIKSIVFQEMQHLTSAANILNAIGGAPDIDNPAFIPKYPGQLPFHIGDDKGNKFEVPLARFSIDICRDVFMRIEEPEKPIEFPEGAAMAEFAMPEFRTIGQAYRAIRDALKCEWFIPNRRQVGQIVHEVNNLDDAKRAIDVIMEEGEGTKTSPLDGMGSQLAHYYRFAEIVHRHMLVPDDSAPEKFSYSGALIPFEPNEVLPIIENPCSADYPPAVLIESDIFNGYYSDLLRALHRMFNGHPETMGVAVGLMFDLELQAMKLMNMPLGDGKNAAPCYQYVP